MDHTREAAIRARAYQLWLESGYADGQQDAHWRQAEHEIAERERQAEAAPGEAGRSATLLSLQVRPKEMPHSDGTSLHPSVLDPRRDRFAA